jgi:hypothetical protein
MYLNNPVLMQNYDSYIPTKVQTTKTTCQILYHLEISKCQWERFCQKFIHRSTAQKWNLILSLKPKVHSAFKGLLYSGMLISS